MRGSEDLGGFMIEGSSELGFRTWQLQGFGSLVFGIQGSQSARILRVRV